MLAQCRRLCDNAKPTLVNIQCLRRGLRVEAGVYAYRAVDTPDRNTIPAKNFIGIGLYNILGTYSYRPTSHFFQIYGM